MEQVSYGPPTCMYGPPHVRLDGPPLPYMKQVSYGPPHVRYDFFQTSFERGPLSVLIKVVRKFPIFVLPYIQSHRYMNN